jgi:hypothetical protein
VEAVTGEPVSAKFPLTGKNTGNYGPLNAVHPRQAPAKAAFKGVRPEIGTGPEHGNNRRGNRENRSRNRFRAMPYTSSGPFKVAHGQGTGGGASASAGQPRSGNGGASANQPGTSGPLPFPQPSAQSKRFHGTVSLDPTGVGRDASRIAEEGDLTSGGLGRF